MLLPFLHLPCGPCIRPVWHPRGSGLTVFQPSLQQALILDLARASWAVFPGARLAWDVSGELLLAEQLGHCDLLTWPESEVVARLPGTGWRWQSGGLLRVDRAQLWKADRARNWVPEAVHALEAPERWTFAKTFSDGTLAALRWRPAMQRLDVVRGHSRPEREETLRLPDLGAFCPRAIAWASDGSGWAALERSRRRVLAWSFPQGWTAVDVRLDEAAWDLVHAGSALVWCFADRLIDWSFAYQHQSVQPHATTPGGAKLAWNHSTQMLAATGPEGVRLFQLRSA